METLLKAAQLAAILKVQPTTIYALVERGVLPHIRIAQGKRRGLIRFRPSDIEAFLQERTAGVSKEKE